MSDMTTERLPDGLRLTRTFDAPREIVFEAWTDPERVQAWWGCAMTTACVSTVEPRVGGKYHHVMTLQGMGDYPFDSVFTEFDPPNKLAYAFTVPPSEQTGGVEMRITNTVEFEDVGGRTKLTITTTGISTDTMKGLVTEGSEASMDKLEKHLSAVAS